MRYLIIILLSLVGCNDPRFEDRNAPKKADIVDYPGTVLRLVDKRYGIVCYTLRGDTLSCVRRKMF